MGCLPLVTVLQVLFDGKSADGVEYVKGGVAQTVKASREVILSSGAIGSPKLLLLSGVGPRQHLEELGVFYSLIVCLDYRIYRNSFENEDTTHTITVGW